MSRIILGELDICKIVVSVDKNYYLSHSKQGDAEIIVDLTLLDDKSRFRVGRSVVITKSRETYNELSFEMISNLDLSGFISLRCCIGWKLCISFLNAKSDRIQVEDGFFSGDVALTTG